MARLLWPLAPLHCVRALLPDLLFFFFFSFSFPPHLLLLPLLLLLLLLLLTLLFNSLASSPVAFLFSFFFLFLNFGGVLKMSYWTAHRQRKAIRQRALDINLFLKAMGRCNAAMDFAFAILLYCLYSRVKYLTKSIKLTVWLEAEAPFS